MTNSIIEAISVSLNKEFGDSHEIYMEEIRQGLEEPCFFIACLNQTTELFLGKRYFRTNQFCVQYFPEPDEKQMECNGVFERMCQCLEYITIYGEDKPIRGTKMKGNMVDGILNFFVNYDYFARKIERETPIEGLQTSINVKEGD